MVAVLALAAMAPQFEFAVNSGTGLDVRVGGVPVLRGTWFQYYEPDWSKGYYGSLSATQQIERIDADTVRLSFRSDDGRAFGTQTFRREGNRLTATYRFEWGGDRPVKVEATAGHVYAPVYEDGTLAIDGVEARGLKPTTYEGQTLEPRRYGTNGTNFEFKAPFGPLSLQSDRPIIAFDSRGYGQPWADRHPVIWLGDLSLDVERGKPAEMTLVWTLPEAKALANRGEKLALPATRVADALAPSEELPVLIPKPKRADLDWENAVEVTGNWTFPSARFRYFNRFAEALARRYRIAPQPGKPAIAIDGGESKLGLAKGGYRIVISQGTVSVVGQFSETDSDGIANAVERLAQLAFVRNGKLYLPTGTVIDEPRRDFRGVHLFVGPQAVDFQKKLWVRVLRPLGFNKVVLQCEQTEWDALPGTRTPITMKKADLARLFQMYRNIDVEPIPLIQSFGHMEWFFANGKNLELAFNPEVPYAIDPRKPEAQAKVEAIWDEAVTLLKPNTLHFGLDEVDMRGFPDDPELVTQLWERQLPFLGGIARKHGKSMMLWGDKALAPGEAVDAAHGDSAEHAQRRRAAIPRGATITDWHYRALPEPQPLLKSLQVFKNAGFRPIASAWYAPDNVRAFNLAADMERVGTLQTTWAGYESNEENMLRNIEQFTAMVLAADYSWSGRGERIDKLPYDPVAVFRKLYFGSPQPLMQEAGFTFGTGSELSLGGVQFARRAEPIALANVLKPGNRPTVVEWDVNRNLRELAFAVDTESAVDEGETVAVVSVWREDGKRDEFPIRYGRQVRAASDRRIVIDADRGAGLCAVRLPLGRTPVRVTRIQIRSASPYAGARIHAATGW